ncbi:MAG: histidinol dehydrogenase [Treponema sp.]|jgi:histidinol dehydrogenase|nr:histidinol dehydrogenase [Treponema sp.]
MKIIDSKDFDEYWKNNPVNKEDAAVQIAVKEVIERVRAEGDKAVRFYASKWDKISPEKLEVPVSVVRDALHDIDKTDPELVKALRLCAENIRRFSLKQREQFGDFEVENAPGLFTGQKVIPVERAAVYVPGGRFPLISSAIMCLVPAFCAGVKEVCLASPPVDASPPGDVAGGLPDMRILAAAGIATEICGQLGKGFRVFSMGGAQAIAALALGTETVPRCDVVAGPGNKYVAAAKRYLFGECGIDLVAGPSDILVIADENTAPDLAAADMLAQAEHDPDARARALVPDRAAADSLAQTIKARLEKQAIADNGGENGRAIARASLDTGGVIIIYKDREEAQRIANAIAPEHLELQVSDAAAWINALKNYGSLFIGALSAEVLGDYSSGLNHTLPTLGSARFTGGLGVRHFLKTQTTLRCGNGAGYAAAMEAAEIIARAEGLAFHAESAGVRMGI